MTEQIFDRSRELVQLAMVYANDHHEEVNDYSRSLGQGKLLVEVGDNDFEEVTQKEVEPASQEEFNTLRGVLLDLVDGIRAEYDSGCEVSETVEEWTEAEWREYKRAYEFGLEANDKLRAEIAELRESYSHTKVRLDEYLVARAAYEKHIGLFGGDGLRPLKDALNWAARGVANEVSQRNH